jgi:hypothetical protein
MSNQQELQLNATNRLIAKNWSGDVKVKHHSPAGLFAEGSAEAIAKWLKKSHGDLKGAMSSLNFYINRAGEGLSPTRKKVLEEVKDKLREMYGKKKVNSQIIISNILYRLNKPL